MATIIADNIITPLGFSAEQTLDAMIDGRSGLQRHEPTPELPFAYTASLFDDEMEREFMVDGFSRFESLALASIRKALAGCDVPMDRRTVLILSSTKGNVGDYAGADDCKGILLPDSATKLARAIGLDSEPLTVCNACVSGVSAIILASRLLDARVYDYAIVCGADIQSQFIISGFHSLKALDPRECRPFDIERLGLNLGEAAGTVVMQAGTLSGLYRIASGCSRNDAYHITNPAPTGQGAMQCIEAVIDSGGNDGVAMINAHGTATMFNDQMESKAISRAALSDVPVNALKGYLGHTMGAAGIVETVLTMHALDRGLILATRGFEEIGVSGAINVSASNLTTDKTSFVKIISGFGGCNAALLLTKSDAECTCMPAYDLETAHHVRITPDGAVVDGCLIDVDSANCLLTSLYKSCIGDYPKFYKMDGLTRLAFVASELLLQCEGGSRLSDTDSRAIVLYSKSGSIRTDAQFIATIKDREAYFPSPSLFVYTLPNITAGEIAIRNKYRGETLFVLLGSKDGHIIDAVNHAMMRDHDVRSLIAGWIEYTDDLAFEADIYLINKKLNK